MIEVITYIYMITHTHTHTHTYIYVVDVIYICKYVVVKNLPADAGGAGSIPWSRRCPGEGNGSTLQYSCLENSVDRGAWWAAVHRVP